MKLCVDYKHFKKASDPEYGKCWKGKIDPVSGRPINYASSLRTSYTRCGPDGELFEQKITLGSLIRKLRK